MASILLSDSLLADRTRCSAFWWRHPTRHPAKLSILPVRISNVGRMTDRDYIMKQNLSLSPGAIRMRRLRERRRRGHTRIIAVEVDAIDAVALREAGFIHQGESARDALPLALKRLVTSIRDASRFSTKV